MLTLSTEEEAKLFILVGALLDMADMSKLPYIPKQARKIEIELNKILKVHYKKHQLIQ